MLNVAVLNLILLGASLVATVFFVRLLGVTPGWFPVGLLAGLGLMLVTLLTPSAGLYVLVYSMLLAPGFGVGQLAERTIELRLDDVFLVLVFIGWFTIATIKKEPFLGLNTPLLKPMLGYIAVALASTILGNLRGDIGYRAAFFYCGKYAQYYMLYYMAFHVLKKFEDSPRYLWAGVITAGAVILWAYRLISLGQTPYPPFNIDRGVAESANLAGYLLLIAGCAGGVALYHPNNFLKVGMLSLILSTVPVILSAGSRATYLAAAGLLAAMLVLGHGRRLILATAAVIMVYILPTLYFGYSETALQRFQANIAGFGGEVQGGLLARALATARGRVQYTFTGAGEAEKTQVFGQAYTLEVSAATRVRQWTRVWGEFLPKHPFLGKGVTAVGLVDAQVPRVIGETGLFGFTFWVWLMASLFLRVYRVFRYGADPLARGLAFGFLTAYCGMLVQSIAVNTFIIIRIMEPFWFLAAVLMRYYVEHVELKTADRPAFRRETLVLRPA